MSKFSALLGLAWLILACGDLLAHEGYPVVLEAKYQEIRRGDVRKAMVFVDGHAHYPDGTRMQVGLRLEGAKQYLCWYDARVKAQGFIAEMGPWRKPLASGSYVIEAWFRWSEQSSAVRRAILKSEEGLEFGTDRCKPEIVEARKLCETKEVFGACLVQVGTWGAAAREEEFSRGLLGQAHETLTALAKEIREERARHADSDKAEAVTRETWEAAVAEWHARLLEVDEALTRWRSARTTVQHPQAYSAGMNVVLALHALIDGYGEQLYDLPADFALGGTENSRQQIDEGLEAMWADLGE